MKTVTTIVCKSHAFKCSEGRAGGMGVQSMGCPVQTWRVDTSWETRREGQCVAFTVLEFIDKHFQGDCIFFKFYFIFKLYNIVLVLPNIKMNPPAVT